MNPEKNIRTWLPILVGVSIAIGIFIGNRYTNTDASMMNGRTNKLDAVLGYINRSYVDTVDMHELIEDALPNILQELDPHSSYISAKEMKKVNEELEGHFSGIGVSFYLLKDTIVVTGIVPGGPSEAAGIKQWDRIINVDDSCIANTNIENSEILKTLRGEKGSEVKLGIKRNGNPNIIDITVTRGDIPMSSIPGVFMQTDDIGYIKVSTFGFNTFNEFISALSKLKGRGAKSFIIDLRGNSGGSLEVVIAMVNEFLDKGDLIVYADGRNFPREDDYANGTGTCKNDDVVVLIDELSASASEIFAGAIQDHDRGLVIGRKSFGKGLVQSQRMLTDGSAVRLTVARYYTPSGRFIQRKFEKGKHDEYEMDAINRYMKGDYVNVDSLSGLVAFKTFAGRTVYGGDGIMPDIFMPRDTIGLNSYYRSIVNKDYIQEYAMIYSDMNRDKLSEFKTYDELNVYLQKQPLLINLVSYADNNGIRPRPYYIQESKNVFEEQMISYIVRNFFGEEGFYPVYLQGDIQFQKAVELIEGGLASPNKVKIGAYNGIDIYTSN